jgi:hypothetical protein
MYNKAYLSGRYQPHPLYPLQGEPFRVNPSPLLERGRGYLRGVLLLSNSPVK